jgi:hypothetical protein
LHGRRVRPLPRTSQRYMSHGRLRPDASTTSRFV